MDIRLLIEALRGGNDPGGLPTVRRYPDGSVVEFNRPTQMRHGKFVNPRGAGGMGPSAKEKLRRMLPTGLRKHQLHGQEVRAGIAGEGDDY